MDIVTLLTEVSCSACPEKSTRMLKKLMERTGPACKGKGNDPYRAGKKNRTG